MPLILPEPTRRGFLKALGFVALAPALIKIEALMPVRAFAPRPDPYVYTLYKRVPLPFRAMAEGVTHPSTIEKYVIESLLPLTEQQLREWQFATPDALGWSAIVMPEQLTPPDAINARVIVTNNGELENAAQIGSVERSLFVECESRDEGRQAAETGGGYRLFQEERRRIGQGKKAPLRPGQA